MLLRFLFLTMTVDATGGQALWSIPLPLIGVTSGNIVLEVTDQSWNSLFRTARLAFGGAP